MEHTNLIDGSLVFEIIRLHFAPDFRLPSSSILCFLERILPYSKLEGLAVVVYKAWQAA